MEVENIVLSQLIRDIIGIHIILKEIQTFSTARKVDKATFCTHVKIFTLDPILQSAVHEDNEAYLKVSAIPKIFPCTK